MSDTTVLPAHVGIVLDGNRRWAREKGIPTLEGHREGAEVFKKIAIDAFDRGVKYLSAFIFSTENWQRTEEEVGYLMKLVIKATESYLDTFHKKGIKIVILGRRSSIVPDVLKAIEKTESKTRNNTKGTLALCFNYAGQEEIVDAVKHLVALGLAPNEISKDVVASALYYPEIPPVDLLIRTSGEYRTSGFMLYRSDYAELYFTEKYWPDFDANDLAAALKEYAARKRRFGA